jgi:hypothetical protein
MRPTRHLIVYVAELRVHAFEAEDAAFRPRRRTRAVIERLDGRRTQ